MEPKVCRSSTQAMFQIESIWSLFIYKKEHWRNYNNYACAKVTCNAPELLQRSSGPIIHMHFSWDSFRSIFIEDLVLTLAWTVILTNFIRVQIRHFEFAFFKNL